MKNLLTMQLPEVVEKERNKKSDWEMNLKKLKDILKNLS